MVSVAVIGAAGYTGQECVRILARHCQVRLAALVGAGSVGQNMRDLGPGLPDRNIQAMDQVDWGEVELAFCCLPHGPAESMAVVAELRQRNLLVIDLSADYRFRNPELYRLWYGHPHSAAHLLPESAYGLAEWNRPAIAGAPLIANPGCYPTASLLALLPVAQSGQLAGAVLIDGKSGATGAGRAARVGNLFCEIGENMRVYAAVRQHRHVGEMEQLLADFAPTASIACFTAQLMPLQRGMICSLYLPIAGENTDPHWQELFRSHYDGSAMVRVLPAGEFAQTALVRGTNQCLLSLHVYQGGLLVHSAIDNLGKGAAGQAVQNMNIRLGFAEEEGLN
jgi:N-acetyl-gamma-glutamyl-phosphate reductase